jgi:DNA repair protein RecO (recombination protein O)
MPDWRAEGIVLSVRPHGESSAILSVLTADHGRHAGLVRGRSSSKIQGVIQPGNRVRVNWRARLYEQLGQMQIELIQSVPAMLLNSPMRLSGVASMCALLDEALPEREAQPGLYDGSVALLDVILLDDNNACWLEGYVRWELGLLAAVGYRLDLTRCVASGQKADLAYVSPKSGGAVALHQAGVFANRMLVLPKFLGGVYCPKHDWIAGLSLTGHFLAKRVFAAHNSDLPAQRKRLADMVDTRYNGQ